jgi:outer membrane receptor protein involved in Fe transport
MLKVNRKKLSLAVMQALGAGAMVGVVVPAALAQTPPTTTAAEVQKFSTTVTGSRIPSANLESTSPITTITAQDIRLFAPLSAENLLNIMPQVIADQGQMVSNGSTGTSNVNLRGLGSARTLVLINGRPMPPGSPVNGGYGADLNEIPLPLVQRVEILTGGASAVYGSDAIAGVVNFIMNDHFEGVQLDVSHSFYQHNQHSPIGDVVAAKEATNPAQFHNPGDVSSDGEQDQYSLIIGGNFDGGKGNATVFLGYQKQKPLLQSQRDFSACSLAATFGDGFACAGSSNTAPAKFTLPNGKAFTIADPAGNVRPYSSASDSFNFGPFNYYQAPDERWNVNAFAHYDVHPRARVYAEFGFHDDHSPRQIAPGADFGSVNTLTFDNPLLSDQLKATFGITPTNPVDVVIQRRNVEGGPRIFDFRTTSYRGVGGVKGEAMDGWNYDLYYMLGRVIYSQVFRNDLSTTKFGRALDAVRDPATGLAACASAVNGFDPACVPWDVFHNGAVTPAQTNYIVTPAFQTGTTERRVFGGTLGADLGMYGWRLPWAKEGVGVSFGYENGIDKLNLETDAAFQSGDIEGLAVLPNHGQIGRKEYFAEVRVPIMEDQPFAQYLAVNGSYRYSDYSINQTANTYGIGVEWNPIREVKLRGSYQQAVRAPNVVELFLPQSLNLFNGQDPCGPGPNGEPPSVTVAQCARSGLPANLYGNNLLRSPAGQLQFKQGGNENLTPETSKSYTLGVVMQPTRNLSASIDYYNIKVDNVISTIPSSLALTSCIQTGAFCDLIHRDAQGTLWLPGQGFVVGTNLNIAKLETDGIDFVANWRTGLPPGWGNFALEFNGTYLMNLKIDSGTGQGSYNCAGFYGPVCNGNAGIAINPLSTWKHLLRGIWTTPWLNIDLAATWRHINSVKLDACDSQAQIANVDLCSPEEAQLAARDYLDLGLSWPMTKQFTMWAGVTNVLDKDPPLAGTSSGVGPTSSNNGNTFPQLYDSLGRHFFVSLTAKF